MHPMLNIAVRAARGAGGLIVRNVDRLDRVQVERKGDSDFVSEVDHLAEQEITRTLKRAYPDHSIIGEESGGRAEGEYVWVVDPLDGTANFLHGLPHFSVSIALLHRGRVEIGVVYDPMRDELFTAQRGGGAMRDGRRIRMVARRGLSETVIGTGFPFKNPEHLPAALAMFGSVLTRAGDVRRTGSAALDLAWVACNRLDGFWEIGLSQWDIAAGTLLVREAGGMVSDVQGGENYLVDGNIVTGSPKLFRELLQAVHPHLTPALKH